MMDDFGYDIERRYTLLDRRQTMKTLQKDLEAERDTHEIRAELRRHARAIEFQVKGIEERIHSEFISARPQS